MQWQPTWHLSIFHKREDGENNYSDRRHFASFKPFGHRTNVWSKRVWTKRLNVWTKRLSSGRKIQPKTPFDQTVSNAFGQTFGHTCMTGMLLFMLMRLVAFERTSNQRTRCHRPRPRSHEIIRPPFEKLIPSIRF